MSNRAIWMDPMAIGAVAILVVSVVAVLWISSSRRFNNNDAKDSTFAWGHFEVREVNAHGENHEYIIWDDGSRGGIAHLPNCKFCKEQED